MTAVRAEFASVEAILAGARRAHQQGFALRDAFTPAPLPELSELVGATARGVRVPMALAGLGVAIGAFALESASAIFAYPFNSGGRPLFSWPVFLLMPFEVGVLAAAIAGFIAFLVRCGFPRLHHPFFDVPGSERATQDRYFLIVDTPDGEKAEDLKSLLRDSQALSFVEAEP
ncbi:DUF3341 domain-containing protein [Rhodoblastus sp.]|uniref:DUF3341 domain-containing protein n=1 Tax=Rhodoblastus sp. TaxID=1962975 RepID=UPI003F98FFD9